MDNYVVEVRSGDTVITAGVLKPTRTAKNNLKRAYARMQSDAAKAMREVPELAPLLNEAGGDLQTIHKLLEEKATSDPTLLSLMQPAIVESEVSVDEFAIRGFQAIADLSDLSPEESRLIMSSVNSPFWEGVDDLTPLVKAIDFFRGIAGDGLPSLQSSNGGVADFLEAKGTGQSKAKKTRK